MSLWFKLAYDYTNNNFTQILKLYRNQLKEGAENICTIMHDQICKAFMYLDVNYNMIAKLCMICLHSSTQYLTRVLLYIFLFNELSRVFISNTYHSTKVLKYILVCYLSICISKCVRNDYVPCDKIWNYIWKNTETDYSKF